MSQLDQLILLAEYNQLMNQRQYNVARKLSNEDLNKDTGAFFKSVLGTLNHILVGDIVWLKRFSTDPSNACALAYYARLEGPKSLDAQLYTELSDLEEERATTDEKIISWLASLSEADLNRSIRYQNMAGKTFNKPMGSLINHLFLHQVHHRGQVSTLLSQFGLDFGETDLLEIIDDCCE